jgi:hypothetical protein
MWNDDDDAITMIICAWVTSWDRDDAIVLYEAIFCHIYVD